MYTLGYAFRPWKEAKAIADGPSILKYVRDTAREAGIDPPHPLHSHGQERAAGRRRTPAGPSPPSAAARPCS
jgi:cation diffusion facilitator CzcD-associated flavoprotein CzcO